MLWMPYSVISVSPHLGLTLPYTPRAAESVCLDALAFDEALQNVED
uniref:Similar to DNA Helicase n=1 Tax=Arundo donax TaxID=35708 RepID=A0A0A8YMV8_ARUDO